MKNVTNLRPPQHLKWSFCDINAVNYCHMEIHCRCWRRPRCVSETTYYKKIKNEQLQDNINSNKNLVKQFFGGHLSGGNFPQQHSSRGQFSWGIFPGGNFLRGFFPGGFFPGGIFSDTTSFHSLLLNKSLEREDGKFFAFKILVVQLRYSQRMLFP